MNFGKKLKALYQNRGYTQQTLASLLEIDQTQLSKIVNGRRDPSFDLLQKIIELFEDTDLNWLMRDQYKVVDRIPSVNEDPNLQEYLADVDKLEEMLRKIRRNLSQK